MFGWGPATRIYLAAGATDMRKGFEGLYGLARDRLLCDPLSGHVFLFANALRAPPEPLAVPNPGYSGGKCRRCAGSAHARSRARSRRGRETSPGSGRCCMSTSCRTESYDFAGC